MAKSRTDNQEEEVIEGSSSPHSINSNKRNLRMIVPDHTGTILIVFYHERGESRVESFPVIAWEVEWDIPRPITVEEIDGAPVYCMKLTTGLWVFPSDTSFTDETKALEYGMSRAKSSREHG